MSADEIITPCEEVVKESTEEIESKQNDENENESKSSRSSYTSVGSEEEVELEREEGDGQEGVPTEKVDDDEDKKNPQYIPKKGIFYEHDDRTVEGEEPESEAEKNEKVGRKTVWIDQKDHWGHDKFNDAEQAPKSKAELIAIYGYDIRNEDGPPKARRRRRYGRGPSKYTRNWEDEDAYKLAKPVKKPTERRNRFSDFVPPVSKSDSEPEKIKLTPSSDSKPSPKPKDKEVKEPEIKTQQVVTTNKENIIHKTTPDKISKKPFVKNRFQNTKDREPNESLQSKTFDNADYRGFTRSRQYRNVKSEQKILPKGAPLVRSQSFSNKNTQKNSVPSEDLDSTAAMMSKISLTDAKESGGNTKGRKHGRQTNVPPRLQTEQKGSKRYSSMRQRSLPETSSPGPHTNFYPNEFGHQRSQPPSTLVISHSNAVPLDHVPPAPLQPIPQQLPVPNPPLIPAQSHYVTPFPPGPPPFLPSSVPQQTFIPAQPSPAGIINYVPGQTQFPHPQTGPFEGFQAQPFTAVTQQPELCQYQGGTTYYSTQGQHIPPRPATIRRPKAAIPIVPPPQGSGGKDRISSNEKNFGADDLTSSEGGEEMFETFESIPEEVKQ